MDFILFILAVVILCGAAEQNGWFGIDKED